MMIKYIIVFFIIILNASTQILLAQSSEKIHKEWNKQGETVTSYFGISLYRGTLYTPDTEPFDIEGTYALTLTYLRSFKEKTLIKSTINEINRIEALTVENEKVLIDLLSNCFVDVSSGDRITALANSKDNIIFFHNGKQQCNLEMIDIRKSFFSIWLGNNTRDVQGSLRLQGLQ